jgi:hypothetical protein
MDANLASIGYEFGPSKYSPGLGYSRLKTVISGRPTQRYFDIKALHVPTFDGRFYHQTQVTRHEMAPKESFQVCLGQLSLETRQGEHIRVFSFGGLLHAEVRGDDLLCDLTSTAPIFKQQDAPGSIGNVIVEELIDLVAEKEAGLAGHEDELYRRLAEFEPYQIFLACLISLQKRADSVPVNLRRDQYHKAVSALHRAINVIKDSDGWDGKAPSLDDLLSGGA